MSTSHSSLAPGTQAKSSFKVTVSEAQISMLISAFYPRLLKSTVILRSTLLNEAGRDTKQNQTQTGKFIVRGMCTKTDSCKSL